MPDPGLTSLINQEHLNIKNYKSLLVKKRERGQRTCAGNSPRKTQMAHENLQIVKFIITQRHLKRTKQLYFSSRNR